MVERDLTHQILSDASYAGIGGWSPSWSHLWRVTRDDLVHAGFKMKPIDAHCDEPTGHEAEGLHINPLEFLAGLINLWIALKIILQAGPRQGGYVVGLKSDNTTMLSWMSEAARTPDPLLQGLARYGSALLCVAAALLTKISPLHIQGILNHEADALSRRDKHTHQIPSINSVINEWCRLRTCRACLLPCELLQKIATITSSPKTVVTYEETMTTLTELELSFLDSGTIPTTLGSTISPP